MADFINTIDILGDDAVIDGIIDRTITEFKDNAITKIGTSAFRGCTELSEVAFPNVTEIGHSAFYGCTQLADIAFPNVTSTQNDAFRLCTSLKAITPETFPKLSTIPYIYSGNVFGESGLVSVDWPSLTSVENGLFLGCASLKSVSLPNLTSFGTYGSAFFNGCSSLESVNLPKLKNVNGTTFYNCTSLKRVELPCVTSVSGNFAFYNNAVLEVVDLPVCTSLSENYTLSNCPALSAFILRSETMCVLKGNAWFSPSGISAGTGYIYVPRALVDSYKSATNWSTWATQFRALEDYTVDGTITGELDETKI